MKVVLGLLYGLKSDVKGILLEIISNLQYKIQNQEFF
jgi:hypothetical protein